MAVKEVSRRYDPVLKVEIVRLEDDYGSPHLVQQSLVPPGGSLAAHDVKTQNGRQNILLAWHEAIVENDKRMLEKNQQGFEEYARARGHKLKGAPVKSLPDPLADYKGCCP
jgi:hypothetical protein